jgi:hypothetical protein
MDFTDSETYITFGPVKQAKCFMCDKEAFLHEISSETYREIIDIYACTKVCKQMFPHLDFDKYFNPCEVDNASL